MADKTVEQLTSLASAADDDLIPVYDLSATVLKKLTFLAFLNQVITALGSTYLRVSNNLSDLANVVTARANLGLGTVATLASSAVFQVANNLSEVASASTARTNLGAAASASPTITGGMTYSGQTKQNIQAIAGTDIDVSLAEFFTTSKSSNTTLTFSGATASKGQGFLLELTIASSAVITWPGSVDWEGGAAPSLTNGVHVLGFLTFDGGTTWRGSIFGQLFS